MALYYLDAQDANYPYQVVRKRLSDGGYVGQMPMSASLVAFSEGKISGTAQVTVLPMGGLGSTTIQLNDYDWASCLPEPTAYSTDAEIMAYLSVLFTGQQGTLVPFALTAGDWMSIEDGVVSFSGGTTNTSKELITSQSANQDGIDYTVKANIELSSDRCQLNYSLKNDTDEITVEECFTTIGTTGLYYSLPKYVDGTVTGTNSFEVTPDNITLTVDENILTIDSDNTSISSYPNTRNDYPTGDPVNLLTTDVNGKIQSFNTGITADISILGITLRFANGILVEYIP